MYADTERISFIYTARVESTIFLCGISFAGLLTFLWVIHLNVRYNDNVFFCYKRKECNYKQPSYSSSQSHFASPSNSALLLLLFQSARCRFSLTIWGQQSTKLIPDADELASALDPYVALKEVVHGVVCLSESHRALKLSWPHLSKTLLNSLLS